MNLANKWLVGSASAALTAAAIQVEGIRYEPYLDIAKIPTVCVGHTGNVEQRKYSLDECTAILKRDLVKHGNGILQCVNVPLTQAQYNAFTLFAFNVGVGAFCSSQTVLAQLNKGNYEAACLGMYKWVYAAGKYSIGLFNRRLVEVAMCLDKS